MIKAIINVEEYNTTALAIEVEHVAMLINQGHTEGRGWRIEGQEEKEQPPEIEEDEEENDTQKGDCECGSCESHL